MSKVVIPSTGEKITISGSKVTTPSRPIIGFIEGDGTGPDIWAASQAVFDATIEKVYHGKRKIEWMEIYAGEKANKVYNKEVWLPSETLDKIKEFKVAIKGPLTTPVGGGFRSINVSLRQELDLFACVRPVRWFKGVPSPVKNPQLLDVTIFRENTEDVYAGIEWQSNSKEAREIIDFVAKTGKKIRPESGIGIKPISLTGSKRLIRKAIEFAITNKKDSVTLVHKGNIMKFTEGAFRTWGYELANDEFKNQTVTEAELYEKYDGKKPEGKVIIKDRIADSMFQQILLRPDEYSVIATTNLNGDYLSDACAAQVGGLGLAPGSNISDEYAVFEATHGTAPKYAGQDKINPGSVILSGVMMLNFIGWNEAADAIVKSLEKTINSQQVTYDIARLLDNVKPIKCSEFGKAIIKNL